MFTVKTMTILNLSLPVPKGACMKSGEEGLLTRRCDRTRGSSLKQEEARFKLGIRKKFLTRRRGEALEQAAQRDCEFPIPAGVQD